MHPNEKVASASASHAQASALLPSLSQGAEVLLLRLRSLGDLVIETSVVRALHEWRPDLCISVLAEERFAAVFEGNPAVAEVILSGGPMATASELRRRNFAVLFNQHGGPRSAMLTGISGARRDIVLLNAAAALVAAGLADRIGEAVPLAAYAIDSGHALQRLQLLVEFTQRA